VKFYYHDGVKETRNGPHQYLVVLHEGEWKIKPWREYSARYAPKLKPFRMLCLRAQARKEGQDADVLIRKKTSVLDTLFTALLGRQGVRPDARAARLSKLEL